PAPPGAAGRRQASPVWPSGTGRRTLDMEMKWSDLLPRLLPVALLALGTGCGGQHEAVEKQLAELRTEIGRLRAREAALSERLDAIDIDRGTFAKGAATAAPGAGPPRPASPASAPP